MLSFGDPSPFADRIREAGAALIIQVTDLEEARHAVDLGADVIVAQGTESGGHGARHGRSILPFVPVEVMRPLLDACPERMRRPVDLTGLGDALGRAAMPTTTPSRAAMAVWDD
ncbi:MAG: dioxygenase [Dactylosporangium sp.]|jgi:NAD(P)H-dependent flavin oxidoreductase YrpB (nitropropane dioxygenase family)|nr:dioxygenase [Dactylosporangium sp.]